MWLHDCLHQLFYAVKLSNLPAKQVLGLLYLLYFNVYPNSCIWCHKRKFVKATYNLCILYMELFRSMRGGCLRSVFNFKFGCFVIMHVLTHPHTDRQTQTDRHRQTDTDRQTQTDRHRQTDTDRQTHRQTEIPTDTHTHTQTHRHK
jgi:hypothetical protein